VVRRGNQASSGAVRRIQGAGVLRTFAEAGEGSPSHRFRRRSLQRVEIVQGPMQTRIQRSARLTRRLRAANHQNHVAP
jgi:hypothetical protein